VILPGGYLLNLQVAAQTSARPINYWSPFSIVCFIAVVVGFGMAVVAGLESWPRKAKPRSDEAGPPDPMEGAIEVAVAAMPAQPAPVGPIYVTGSMSDDDIERHAEALTKAQAQQKRANSWMSMAELDRALESGPALFDALRASDFKPEGRVNEAYVKNHLHQWSTPVTIYARELFPEVPEGFSTPSYGCPPSHEGEPPLSVQVKSWAVIDGYERWQREWVKRVTDHYKSLPSDRRPSKYRDAPPLEEAPMEFVDLGLEITAEHFGPYVTLWVQNEGDERSTYEVHQTGFNWEGSGPSMYVFPRRWDKGGRSIPISPGTVERMRMLEIVENGRPRRGPKVQWVDDEGTAMPTLLTADDDKAGWLRVDCDVHRVKPHASEPFTVSVHFVPGDDNVWRIDVATVQRFQKPVR
jgi:hypothetical protein